jgi:carbon-monoxide dehydrogenase large subunit
VGVEAARAAEILVHDDVPGNVSARMLQEVGDAPAAIDAAPHVLELDLDVERSLSSPLEGRGVVARWDHDEGSMRIWSSTQTSTGVRAAVAAKLGLPLAKVECITPDVGGGFGVKIMHPWPEEVLVPWAARLLRHDVSFVEDRREHFISSAHERRQLQHVRVGFDDGGRILGLDVTIWHDNGAYTPVRDHRSDHQLDAAARAVQAGRLPGRVLLALHEHRRRHAVPRRGPAAGRVRDGADDGRDRRVAGHGPRRRPSRELHPARRVPVRPRPDLPGRTAAHLRLRRLPRVARKTKALVGWEEFEAFRDAARAEGRRVGIGLACYVEGTGVGPYEGAHVHVETSGRVDVSIGLTTQGQGHQTAFAQIAADTLGVRLEDVHVTSGDTRRFRYAVGTFASRAA